MALKCIILFALVAVASAGYLGAPALSYATPAAYAAPAYAPAAYAHGLAAPALAARAYAPAAYAAPALAARAVAPGLLGVAYSAAPVVSHMTYDNGYGIHYAY